MLFDFIIAEAVIGYTIHNTRQSVRALINICRWHRQNSTEQYAHTDKSIRFMK